MKMISKKMVLTALPAVLVLLAATHLQATLLPVEKTGIFSKISNYFSNVYRRLAGQVPGAKKPDASADFLKKTTKGALVTGGEKPLTTEEKGESLEKFPYTMSMAHLMTVTPGGVSLTPEPQDPKEWLWSDGMLNSDGETYTVTYNGKNYVSTYNKAEDRWETSTPMDYFTYHDYLASKGKKGVEKENFIGYLIGRFTGKKPNSHVLNVYKTALLREERYSDEIVFYNAHMGGLTLFQDFCYFLNKYLDQDETYNPKRCLERSRFESTELFESADAYLKKYKRETEGIVISANAALFGNSKMVGSYTPHYFTRNTSLRIRPTKIKLLILELCKNIGIRQPMLDRLETLYEEYYKIGGKLQQFITKPTCANRVSYVSAVGGIPYQNFQKFLLPYAKFLTSAIAKKAGVKPSPALVTSENVIGFLRTNPQNKGSVGANAIDNFQIRLLNFSKPFTDKKEAEKCDIKTYYYYAEEGTEQKEKELRKKVGLLVQEMLADALENGTLKGLAAQTKLAQAYNEGKWLLSVKKSGKESKKPPIDIEKHIGEPEIARFLLEHFDVLNTKKDVSTAVKFASENGDKPLMDRLINKYKALENPENFLPLLRFAIEKNDKALLKALPLIIEKSANINVADKDDVTPLMIAAQYDQIKIAKLLIEKGALNDPQMASNARKLAIKYNRTKILKLIDEALAKAKIIQKVRE